MNKSTFLLCLLTSIGFASCTTYQMSISVLKERFHEIYSTDLKRVKVIGPLGKRYDYLTHPNNTIELVDKNGKDVVMPVKPSIEMRVTHDGGERTYFYLDKIFVNETYLIGDQSRLIGELFFEKILLDRIEKIEVQDGKKNFRYLT